MVGFLLFCVYIWAGVFAQEKAGNQVVFKVICQNGTGVEFECTAKQDCTWKIDATDKRIRIIEYSTLADCAEVEELFLYSNKISEISKNAFRDQRKLWRLILNFNQIKVLTPGVFDPLTSLTRLGLEGNFIEVVDDFLFAKNSKLEQLWLNDNKIFAVGPNVFKKLSHLKEMRIYGNPCMHPNITSGKNPQHLGIFFSEKYGNKKWSIENNECVSSYFLQQNFKECKAQNNLFMEEKSSMIFYFTIIIILLISIITAQFFIICKLKTKNAAKKEEIIRLDRIFPYDIYEMPYQGPEPVYIEIE